MKVSKWPNKGIVKEAINGNLNLIKLVFNSKNEYNKLKLKSFIEVFLKENDRQISKLIINEVKLKCDDKNDVKTNV